MKNKRTYMNVIIAFAWVFPVAGCGPGGKPVVAPNIQALIADLDQSNPANVRIDAAKKLGELGPAAAPAVPALVSGRDVISVATLFGIAWMN